MNKIAAVKNFFNNTEGYLHNNYNIKLRRDIISRFVKDLDDKKVLDIGCGDGSLSMQFIDTNEITFLDQSEKMLEIVNRNLSENQIERINIINDDFLSHQFNSSYDLILCIGVLAHVNSVDLFIKKMLELLNNDGRSIVQISDRDKFMSRIFDKSNDALNRYQYKVNYLNATILNSILLSNGCKVIETAYFWRPYRIFKLIPEKLKRHILNFINKNKFLSNFGSELFIVFQKNK